jgi:zinc/manganese transport system substrate-binding protein
VRRTGRWGARRAMAIVAAAAGLILTVAGCATSPTPAAGSTGGGKVQVVAAENFWGSLATQLGGEHATVTSIINNPDADPHDYEPSPADGRTMATAQYAVVNGIGYDPWAQKLLDASPSPNRQVLDVGKLAGVPDGGNPHQWYSPDTVTKVIDQMTADFKRIDPADAAYFDAQHQQVVDQNLARYHQLIGDIKAKYSGTPIGASESIVTPLAAGLGLQMLTPESLLDAVAEGNDPSAGDKTTADAQISTKQIKVYVFNSQNADPDVQAQVDAARAAGIPVATVTETMTPATSSFQDWQVGELQGIEAALAQATGR